MESSDGYLLVDMIESVIVDQKIISEILDKNVGMIGFNCNVVID